jgi:hypothetical protein
MRFPALSAALLLGSLMAGAGCAPVDLDGDWSGTWRATFNVDSGTLSMSLKQDGDSFDGSFDIGGTGCVGSGSVEGTIDARDFSATLRNGLGGDIELDGTVSADSKRISGDFEVTGGFCVDAKGTFEVEAE